MPHRRTLSSYIRIMKASLFALAFLVGVLGGVASAKLTGPKKRNAFAVARIRASSNDLRYLCQDNCGSIGSNDLRYYCQGNCGSIGENDLRYYCQKNCGSISNNELRYACQGNCGSI